MQHITTLPLPRQGGNCIPHQPWFMFRAILISGCGQAGCLLSTEITSPGHQRPEHIQLS